jgi:Putative transposase
LQGPWLLPVLTGRRMNATAANLIERVLPPQSGLRQWVLTFPFSWRRRLAQDGALLGRLTRIVVETVLTFYAARAREESGPEAKSGAVTAVQRTSSDLRLNPHLHMIALDGQRSREHRPLPRHGGRGDRGASAVAGSRSAVLEEPRARP